MCSTARPAPRLLLFVLPVECIAGLTLDAVYGRTHPARADPRLAPKPGHPGQPHHPAGGHRAATVSASTPSPRQSRRALRKRDACAVTVRPLQPPSAWAGLTLVNKPIDNVRDQAGAGREGHPTRERLPARATCSGVRSMSERESITGRSSSWLAKQSPRSRWTTTIPRGVAEHQSRAARAGPNRRTRRVGTFGPVVVARFGEDCPVSVALLGGARCVFAS